MKNQINLVKFSQRNWDISSFQFDKFTGLAVFATVLIIKFNSNCIYHFFDEYSLDYSDRKITKKRNTLLLIRIRKALKLCKGNVKKISSSSIPQYYFLFQVTKQTLGPPFWPNRVTQSGFLTKYALYLKLIITEETFAMIWFMMLLWCYGQTFTTKGCNTTK